MIHELQADESVIDMRLDVWLERELEGCSRSLVARLIKSGNCNMAPGKLKPGWRLRGDEHVRIEVPEAESLDIVAEEGPLEVLYEDDDLLVLNKPPQQVVHPAIGHVRGTLMNAVAWRAEQAGWQAGLIHRLDEDTSGIICVAKSAAVLAACQESFRERRVKKRYVALVHGRPKADVFDNNKAIGRHPKDFRKRALVEDGKASYTSFVVRERHEDYAVLEARPTTGRTHQIRVHVLDCGHPVLADRTYSRSDVFPVSENSSGPHLTRQGLHAWYLKIPHPQGGVLEIIAPPPVDMATFIETDDLRPLELDDPFAGSSRLRH